MKTLPTTYRDGSQCDQAGRVETTRAEEPQLSPKQLLEFAQRILIWLWLSACLAGFAYVGLLALGLPLGAKVFETLLLTVLPSLVTLIVGFYFGKRDR